MAGCGAAAREPMETVEKLFTRRDYLSLTLIFSLALNVFLLGKVYGPQLLQLQLMFSQPRPVTEDEHIRGNRSAPVTVIVYSDFECPYCRVLHQSLLDLSRKEDFRWVYRHT